MSTSRRSRSRQFRRAFANVLVVLLGLIALILIVGLFLPRNYLVVRSVDVRAKAEAVYPDLAGLRRWPEWTVWNREMDPTVEFQYESPDTGAGAAYRWVGAKLGSGRLALTRAEPEKGVWYDLAFDDGKYLSQGSITMEPAADGVRVTWTNEGSLGRNPLNRYFGLMMDSMLGPDFEAGLTRLKARAEGAGP